MVDIKQALRENREWLKRFFSGNPEMQQIKKEFDDCLEQQHGTLQHPRIATGHQPVIYYPGLLFKDFFTGEAATELGGSVLNMVVDTDQAQLEMPVPTRKDGELHKARVRLSNPQGKAYTAFRPSRQSIDHFLGQTEQHLHALSVNPILESFQAHKKSLCQLLDQGHSLVHSISLLRQRLNNQWGFSPAELTVSHLAGSYAYFHYLWYIIQHIHPYTRHYNQAVEQGKKDDYQPVKFLQSKDGWYELPFWLSEQGRRLPVMVYKDSMKMIFRSHQAGRDTTISLDGKDETSIISEMQEKLVLYPKATALTQIIRLFLSELFIHGRGAVEYEKINNAFLQNFFDMESRLHFFAVTGDIFLPLVNDLPPYQELKKAHRGKSKWLKQVSRNPEDHLEDGLSERYKEKKKQVARMMSQEESPEKRKSYHRQLEALNEEMKELLAGKIEETRKELQRYENLLQNKEVYYERQYPYYLYPGHLLTKANFRQNIKVEQHN